MSDLPMRGKPSDTELLDAMIQNRWAITDYQGAHFTLIEVRDRRGTVLAVDADPRRAIEQARVAMGIEPSPPKPLRADLAEALDALGQEQDALAEYIAWSGAAHQYMCPEDDTCECKGKPVNDAVNAAYIRAADVLSKHASHAARYNPALRLLFVEAEVEVEAMHGTAQPECPHDFVEVYYGHQCSLCGLFFAFGCAPWDTPPDEWDLDWSA